MLLNHLESNKDMRKVFVRVSGIDPVAFLTGTNIT